MTTSLDTIRKLHAWKEGKPLPRGEVVNVWVTEEDDLLIIAFVRMGGESRPWGVAIGTLSDGPEFFTVPEGRNRALVADMMVLAAEKILAHFKHPSFNDVGPVEYSDSIRQLWLPGPTHVEMLQCLAAAYARSRWQRPDIDALRALGNLCNALFMEYQRPGQQTVVSATEALRTCYTFPTANVRQGHLGHLLGWLEPNRSRKARLSLAHESERDSFATVLNPDFERDVMQPLVEKWGEFQKKDSSEAPGIAQKISKKLETELRRRWDATAQAARVISGDAREYNDGLAILTSDSNKLVYREWGERALRESAGEIPYWPSVYSESNARSAARNYQKRIGFQEKARHLLVHGDREMQREELAAGHGVICKIKTVDRNTGQWVVTWSYPELPSLKEGDTLAIAGAQKMKLKIDEVDIDTKTMLVSPQWKKALRLDNWDIHLPSDPRWRGTNLVLLDDDAHGLAERKAKTAGKRFGDRDITILIGNGLTQHSAYDEEGLVQVATEDEDGS
jgi:hypothetical protein